MNAGRRNKWACVCVCLFSSEGRQINGIAWEPKTLQVVSGHINKSVSKPSSIYWLPTISHEGFNCHQDGWTWAAVTSVWDKISYKEKHTAEFTQLVWKSLKKKPSQPKSSQKLSQNADRIFKYNSKLNNELRINSCYLGVICTELRGPTDPGPSYQESVFRHNNLSVLFTALLGHLN